MFTFVYLKPFHAGRPQMNISETDDARSDCVKPSDNNLLLLNVTASVKLSL